MRDWHIPYSASIEGALMRFPWSKDTHGPAAEHRSYTDDIMAAEYARVSGNDDVDAASVGLVAYGIGIYVSAFAIATVTPALPALSPSYLASVARRLMLSGNAVDSHSAYGVNPGWHCCRAATWDVSGPPDPSRWRYTVDLRGSIAGTKPYAPSADGVIHHRINNVAYPWQGVSPLQQAGLTSKMLSYLELRLGQEAGGRTGYINQYDVGTSAAAVQKIESDYKLAAGGSIFAARGGGVETSRGVGGWERVRLGATIPESNIMLRKDVALDALASLNINPRLVIGDGSAVREAFRQMYPTIVAIGRIVSAELSRALDTTVEIDFSDLAAQDVTARARAYASYVGAGMPAELAAANAGVMET